MKYLIFLLYVIFFGSQCVQAQSCYKASILSPNPFMGNHGEITKLSDGTIWEIQYEYEYMYEYTPSVIACPSRGLLLVNDKKINARLISQSGGTSSPNTSVLETYIEGQFSGLEMGRIFKLGNGQIWEQTEAWIWHWYWFQPRVMIYSQNGLFKMKVENIDKAVFVRRLK